MGKRSSEFRAQSEAHENTIMIKILFQIALLILPGLIFPAADLSERNFLSEPQDTLQGKQLLYNGRVWWNQHIKVRGHAYYLSGDFNPGNVKLKGKEYKDLQIKYDIFFDEIILFVDPKTIIVLNKEMIDGFSFSFENIFYNVRNFGSDSTSLLNGYANVLYEGPTSFYVKFLKKIEPLAEEKKYDRFYQVHRMYIMHNSTLVPFSGKKGLLDILEDRKKELNVFIKENRTVILRKDPYSFIPVIKYYDSLRNNLH